MLGVIACGLGTWVFFRIHTGTVLEDALITFRHSENLASGQGYGFNPGEWVQGSTTPLLTLLLAFIAVCVGPEWIPLGALVLGLAGGGLTAGVSADLLRRWGCSPATQALAIGGWLLTPRVVWSGVGGMETPLVGAAMAASLWATERRDGVLLGASLAALVLLRPDGAVWVVLILPFTVALWRRAWPFLIPLFTWAAWSTWAFGSPIPHPLLAKSFVHPRVGPLFTIDALTERLSWTSDALSAPFPAYPPAGWAVLLASLVLVWTRSHVSWRVPALFVVAFPLILHLGRAPNFYWYSVPVAWAAALVGACTIEAFVRRISSRIVWAVVVLGLVGGVVHLQPLLVEAREVQQNELLMRAEVGRWIDTHAPADASVAMETIGYQGTLSHRRVVDLAGLVSPEVLEIARNNPRNAARFEQILDTEMPWAVVLRSWEVGRNRHFHGGRLFRNELDRQRFLTTYVKAARFSAPFPKRMGRNRRVVVYVRVAP